MNVINLMGTEFSFVRLYKIMDQIIFYAFYCDNHDIPLANNHCMYTETTQIVHALYIWLIIYWHLHLQIYDIDINTASIKCEVYDSTYIGWWKLWEYL